MKTFSFQILFTPSADQEACEKALEHVLWAIKEGMGENAQGPHVEKGEEFINITVAIVRPLDFWNFAKPKLQIHAVKLIVVAEGDRGWDDYLLLYHFDEDQFLDDLPADG